MQLEEIKEALQRIILLLGEVENLTKPRAGFSYLIHDYASRAHQIIISPDYGERDKFYVPFSSASMKLQDLINVEKSKFETAFQTMKATLIKILNNYIKGIQRGIQEHLTEQNA